MSNLNPDVKKFMVGSREMVETTIFPLALKEETDLIKIIAKTVIQITGGDDFSKMKDEELVTAITGIINTNLEMIFKMVTDNNAKFDEMSNNQLMEFSNAVFDMNFETFIKNGQSLIEKVKSLIPSMGQLPQSVNDTVIPSETFSPSDIKKEDLPDGKL